MDGRFAENPRFVEYEKHLLRLQALNAQGRAESKEADQVRDQMDEPWLGLSREERDWLGGLSSDLYMLTDEEISEPVDPVERGPDTLGISLSEAKRRGDWGQILKLLRKGPTFFPKPTIAFLRGLYYLRLGHPQVALLFLDYATKLAPQDEDCAVLSLDVLKQLGRHDDALVRAKRYLSDPNVGLSLSVHSMSEVFRATRSMSEEEAKPIYEALTASLREKLGRTGRHDPETEAFAYLLLGACLEFVGRYDEALAAYNSSADIYRLEQAYIAMGALLEKVRDSKDAEAGPSASKAELLVRNIRHRENRFRIVLNAEPPPVAA